ncbi:Npun_R2821/Npun_R2822 family protein [Iningainema tapete]|uniref:Sugar transferase n=1 Tax=Iningainema tapete BLCC-T55 TaxID=2748662 RepID=A0A8J6XRU0_9CYAN|nr:Npun_R2821/Npun_R2822 family protein [Iningainema tapete]MBD2778437.1 sugar transferase [Iningainema tapete BLCC-T55]
MSEGIYILANDVVYDQLVALLNSIEANAGKNYPICIIPYDDRLSAVQREITNRSNVEIFADTEAIARWEDFSTQVWAAHPNAFNIWQKNGISGVYRMGMHRRFCTFDGPFDKFIYLDADIIVLNSLDYIFQQLNNNEFVVYDFQYKDLSHVFNVNSNRLLNIFPQSRLESEIFCAGLYAGRKGIFNEERRNYLLSQLRQGEAEILYMNAPDQTILNYMVMRSGITSYNFAQHLREDERTGCCVTSPHFETRDHILYDKGNRLTYLHYIGLSSKLFSSVCAGENIDFPYRELFLHYRYLHQQDLRPKFKSKPKAYNAPPSLATRILRKLKLAL